MTPIRRNWDGSLLVERECRRKVWFCKGSTYIHKLDLLWRGLSLCDVTSERISLLQSSYNAKWSSVRCVIINDYQWVATCATRKDQKKGLPFSCTVLHICCTISSIPCLYLLRMLVYNLVNSEVVLIAEVIKWSAGARLAGTCDQNPIPGAFLATSKGVTCQTLLLCRRK